MITAISFSLMYTFVFDFYIAGTKSYGVVWQYAETESRAREMILEKVDSVKSADICFSFHKKSNDTFDFIFKGSDDLPTEKDFEKLELAQVVEEYKGSGICISRY
jgi:hypothetical protein